MRLRAKLALALVPLVVVPVFSLGWLTWESLRDKLHGEAERAMEATLLLADQGLTNLVADADAHAALLAAAPETLALVASSVRPADDLSGERATVLRLFEQYRVAYPDYLAIRLLAQDGAVLAGTVAIGFLPLPIRLRQRRPTSCRRSARGRWNPIPACCACASPWWCRRATTSPRSRVFWR